MSTCSASLPSARDPEGVGGDHSGFWLDFPVTHTQIHILESEEQAPSREHKPISIGPHTAYTVESVEDAARHSKPLASRSSAPGRDRRGRSGR